VTKIESNTKRYLQIFAEAIDNLMPTPTEAAEPDIADILAMHVSKQHEREGGRREGGEGRGEKAPRSLHSRSSREAAGSVAGPGRGNRKRREAVCVHGYRAFLAPEPLT
jgi:hypothetical protein